MSSYVLKNSLYQAPSSSECVIKCSIPHNFHCPKINGYCVFLQKPTSSQSEKQFGVFLFFQAPFTQTLEVCNLLSSCFLSILVRKGDGKYFHVLCTIFHHACNSSMELYGMLFPIPLYSFNLNSLSALLRKLPLVEYCQNYCYILLPLSLKEFFYLLLPAHKLANVHQSSEWETLFAYCESKEELG